MKRVYHRYEVWEEYAHGMWRKVSNNEYDEFLRKAIEFTGDTELYGSYMMRVANEWPYSCEHNLTCSGMNRQAWIGHAACCLAISCPEYITRDAWWMLSQEQRDKANLKADEAIAYWESKYA